MHDPQTVAFEIRYPWRAYGKKERARSDFHRTYRSSFITIWHVDPETDGSDDSCGWSSPKLSKVQKERINIIAQEEAKSPWYLAFRGKQLNSPTEAQTLLTQAFITVGKFFSKDHRCKPATIPPTYAEAQEWSAILLGNGCDSLRGSLSFLPGWDGNRQEDNEHDREYKASRLFYSVARYFLRERRPWYRHPRWHIWHWKFQVHPLEQFKRWAFSRCCKCGKGFRWGESPCTNSWNSEGPRWFRSESAIYHGSCDRSVTQEAGNV